MRLVIALIAGLALLGLVACPAAKVPTGPGPEYEDPPPPSWLEPGVKSEAGPSPASTIPDAGLTD